MSESLIGTNAVWMLSGQVSNSEPVREVSINTSPFQIGRRPDLAFCLPIRTVSNLHASIHKDGERIYVEDLGSTNGTFLNGSRIASPSEVQEGDLLQFADLMFRVKRTVSDTGHTVAGETFERAMALIQFDKLMTERAVTPFVQPIVSLPESHPEGYEVLARSRLFGLRYPQAMFLVASQLNLAAELSRMLRWEGLQAGDCFPARPPLFLNTHPTEILDLRSLESHLREIRRQRPDQPLTLEIHESAVTSPQMMREVRGMLGQLGVQLAYDDFGAGQARLIELVEVPPDVLKFDISLIKDVDKASRQRQRMLAGLVQLARDLGVAPLAEGIETLAEHQACIELGFTFGQGFYYGRPAPAASYQSRGGE
ncbi:MAG: EAL domain-containing protein [Pirellulaceae bacterium]|nr:EAL domain-containing protein [Pirellulaceae bacterium]